MGDDARIAHRGAFDGVLAREGGAEQQSTRVGERLSGAEPVAELGGMSLERVDQPAMTAEEPTDDIVERPLHLVLAEGENAVEHGRSTRVLVVETLLAWHEQLRDDPRRIGIEPQTTSSDA